MGFPRGQIHVKYSTGIAKQTGSPNLLFVKEKACLILIYLFISEYLHGDKSETKSGDTPRNLKEGEMAHNASLMSSRMSFTAILFSTSSTLTASSKVVTQYGQATARTSTPSSKAS